MNIFYNTKEQRLRAGWRLLLQFILMSLFTALGLWAFSYLLYSDRIILTIPRFIGTIASIWLAARFLDRRSLIDFGLQFNIKWVKDFLFGALFAALGMGVIFLVEWKMEWLSITAFGWHGEAFSLELGLFFISMLMVGFHEELFSRGYQLLNLVEGLHYERFSSFSVVSIAVLLTSSLFGFLHAFNPNATGIAIFNIVIAGIVLAIPYILTGSLALSVGMHFSWNFVQAGVFGFPVSGLNIPTTIIETQTIGPKLWTGGAFGPEAGLLGLTGMAIMLGATTVYILKTRYKLEIDERFRQKK